MLFINPAESTRATRSVCVSFPHSSLSHGGGRRGVLLGSLRCAGAVTISALQWSQRQLESPDASSRRPRRSMIFIIVLATPPPSLCILLTVGYVKKEDAVGSYAGRNANCINIQSWGDFHFIVLWALIYNEPLFNPAKDYCSPVVRSFGDPGRDFSFQVCLRIALRRTPLNLKHISIKNVE